MKKFEVVMRRNVLWSICLLFGLLMLSACSDDDNTEPSDVQNSLIGTWEVLSVDAISDYGEVEIGFNVGDYLIFDGNNTGNINGDGFEWNLSDNRLTIKETSGETFPAPFEIESLDKSRLILILDMDSFLYATMELKRIS